MVSIELIDSSLVYTKNNKQQNNNDMQFWKKTPFDDSSNNF